MLSEIDLRDWEHSIYVARDAMNDIPYDRVNHDFVYSFIDKVEAMVFTNQKQVAALFKPPVYNKMADGCCHKTVTSRCVDCSFKVH